METQLKDDITELKVNQALIVQRQDNSDKVIERLEVSLEKLEVAFGKLNDRFDKIAKGGYIFLGIYIANSIGAGDAVKALLKVFAGV